MSQEANRHLEKKKKLRQPLVEKSLKSSEQMIICFLREKTQPKKPLQAFTESNQLKQLNGVTQKHKCQRGI